jgi:Papain family cysteine protease
MRQQTRPRLYCLPSGGTWKDWDIDTACEKGVMDRDTPLPAAVDLRRQWWPVTDQGLSDSCVGWVVADLLRWHFVRAGRLNRRTRLSARYVWMAAKEKDEFRREPTGFLELEGTSLKAALRIGLKFGVVTEGQLPFELRTLPRKEWKDWIARANEKQRRITGYYKLSGMRNRTGIWRRWLAFQGPIAVRVAIDATWLAAKVHNGELDVHERPTGDLHAALLVGYDFERWPGRFIIRNSEGRKWGDAGFGYATAGYCRAAIDQAYGVTV